MLNVSLIFAGGVGSRMGSEMPKQYLEWNGKAIIVHTLEVFEKCEEIDEIYIACKEDWIDYTKELINKSGIRKVVSIVPGGATALESQYNGLREINRRHENLDVAVLIHDGVRPLVDEKTIKRCLEGVKDYGSAITVTKAIETVITINDEEKITGILDRNFCRMAKAPQCFMLKDILSVHEEAIKNRNHNFIDSASMMMAHGFKLHTIMGEPENIKITTPSDYYMYLGISKSRQEQE